MSKTYWVGVLKTKYTDHEVVHCTEADANPEKYPQYDYMVGPFDNEEVAKTYAKKEKNKTGTFVDPFCNNGGGR